MATLTIDANPDWTDESEPALPADTLSGDRLAAIGRSTLGIAHRLNNELAIILSYASLLTEELPPGSEHQAFAERVVGGGERAVALVEAMLSARAPG